MIICVDARPLVEKKVGFGFFLQNMLEEIFIIDKSNEYILLSDRQVFFDVTKYNNVKIIQYKDGFILKKTFYYYFKLQNFLKKRGIIPDIFWATNHIMPRGFSENTMKVLTIHDFTHLKFPKSTTKFNLLISKLFFSTSIKNADNIICISKNTKSELEKYYFRECTGKIISTIYEGGYARKELLSDEIDMNNIRSQIISCGKRKFVLFIGTIEPRKNIKLLIEAAPKLQGIVEIVVCGKIGWESSKIISKLHNTRNLTYFNYITQDEKKYLMKNTVCQVQPSLYEGFGLPVVESMQAGTVVMVANNSSLKELVEMDNLKFETADVNDFCKKICELNDPIKYQMAKDYCLKRGKYFDWRVAAKEYISIFTS